MDEPRLSGKEERLVALGQMPLACVLDSSFLPAIREVIGRALVSSRRLSAYLTGQEADLDDERFRFVQSTPAAHSKSSTPWPYGRASVMKPGGNCDRF